MYRFFEQLQTKWEKCVFGNDPKDSVLDTNCKTHDLDNVYLVDWSFFPSSGAVNPGLTIIANALRMGDILCSNQQKKSLHF